MTEEEYKSLKFPIEVFSNINSGDVKKGEQVRIVGNVKYNHWLLSDTGELWSFLNLSLKPPKNYISLVIGDRLSRTHLFNNTRCIRFDSNPDDESLLLNRINKSVNENLDRIGKAIMETYAVDGEEFFRNKLREDSWIFSAIKSNSKHIDLSKAYMCENTDINSGGSNGQFLMCASSRGELKNKGFFITDELNWEIVTEPNGDKILVPTKK